MYSSNRDNTYTALGAYRGNWREDTSMVKLSPEHVYFNMLFAQIERTKEARLDWDTGNGYFTLSVDKSKKLQYVDLYPREMVKSTHISGRKIIFLGTHLGTLAIFEARSPGNRNNRITMYAGSELMQSGLVQFTDFTSVARMRDYVFNSKDEPGAMLRDIRIYAEARNKAKLEMKG